MSGQNKILVLGSTGKVGTLLKPHLEKLSDFQIFFHLRKNNKKQGGGENIIDCDLSNTKNVVSCFKSNSIEFDIVVGLAGLVNKNNDSLKDNIEITRNSLLVCKLVKAKRFLFFSSSSVYGPGIDMHEADVVNPTSPYGQAKRACEVMLESAKGNVEISCLRVGNIAGADALMSKFVKSSLPHNDISLSIFSNGQGPVRSYITPKSLTDVLISLIKKKSKLPFLLNLATIPKIAMRDCLLSLNSPWSDIPDIRRNTQIITLNCQKLQNLCPDIKTNMSTNDFMDEFKMYLPLYRENLNVV